MGIIKRELNKYNLFISKLQYKDLMDNVTFHLINCIDNCSMRYPGQIVNYINIVLKYKILDYLIQNIFNKSYSYIDEINSKNILNSYIEF